MSSATSSYASAGSARERALDVGDERVEQLLQRHGAAARGALVDLAGSEEHAAQPAEEEHRREDRDRRRGEDRQAEPATADATADPAVDRPGEPGEPIGDGERRAAIADRDGHDAIRPGRLLAA